MTDIVERLEVTEVDGRKLPLHELRCEAAAEIKRLRKALLFYAHPEKVKPRAVWNEDYPGGITYSEGDYVYLDNGDMAREALGE